MEQSYTRRFRWFCIAEGFSWLALLIAMAVKYTQHMPEAVRWPGLVHGFCFIGYVITAIPMFRRVGWPVERAYGVGIAGFLPFGTFVLERKWLK